MPTATTDDGVDLYYETAGSGETVAFVGEAGLGAWQWGWQHRTVTGQYETLVWDLRGTGRSDAPAGPYDVDRLATDLEHVLSEVGAKNCHLVGVGLGGMVALRYARKYTRAETLTLFNTAASGEEIDEPALRALCGPSTDSTAANLSLPGGFSESFRSATPDVLDQIREWRQTEDAQAEGFEAQRAAMQSFEAGPLYELTVPALVCHGLSDPVVEFSAGKQLAKELPRGVFEAVEGRHLCFIEHSRAVNDRFLEFLAASEENRA